ncbi:hypothetical protein ACFWNQ_32140 [Streptomyces virginiae]|uniref:hypothetical protein n=1 Tax=Streptomyces virginiae TaxID=1961 RepID=UPI0036509259
MTDSEVIVDLRGRRIETLDDFWDAVSGPCGPDTINTRGISDVIDSHDFLVVHVDGRGLFDGSRREGRALSEVFDAPQNRLIVHTAA